MVKVKIDMRIKQNKKQGIIDFLSFSELWLNGTMSGEASNYLNF